MPDDRDKKLDLARKLAILIDHPKTLDTERASARTKLQALVEEYGFLDEEVRPVEPLDDVPIDPGMSFDDLLARLGITREQLNGFVGELAIRGLTKLGTALAGAITGKKK